jgi:glutamate racemase
VKYKLSTSFASALIALLASTHCAPSQTAATPTPRPTKAEVAGQSVAAGGAEHLDQTAAPTALIQQIGEGRSTLFPLDRKAYETVDARLPIGVFDSGIGGLTVLSAILELDEFDNKTHKPGRDGVPDFANERFVYFGDQANMPYGRYASEGKEDFLRELIVEDAAFLLGNRYWPTQDAKAPATDKPLVKAVVVACNTATAYGIDDLRAAFGAWKIPMILVGVVEAGAEGAVASMKQRGDDGSVAVMATVGTCKSQAYPRNIDRVAHAQGVRSPKVVQQGSVGLAGAIEGDPSFVRPSTATSTVAVDKGASYQGPAVGNPGAKIDPALGPQYGFDPAGMLGDPKTADSWRLNSVDNYVRYDVTTLVEAHKRESNAPPINTVVLGCTHFPFQREQIATAFERLRTFRDASGAHPYENVVSAHVALVDPAKLTASELYRSLAAKSRLREADRAPGSQPNLFFISKPNSTLSDVKLTADGTFDASYKYGRKAGNFEHETVKRVPMRTSDLTPELQRLLEKSMPAVWESMKAAGARDAHEQQEARP